MISVALCTYNGDRFLAEQLASIRNQARLPDEVVLCDDRSTDATLAIARRFAEAVPFPVRIEANASNLGSTRNFAQAIELCRGDMVVLADQDDVWLPHKLAVLERALLDDPGAGFAFSDAEMVDEHLQPLGYKLWDALRFSARERRCFRRGEVFHKLLRRYRVTGATLAFRSRFKDLILPIPPEWVHDAWIGLLIATVASCRLIDEPLLQYRQHARQQLGERKRSLYQQYQAARKVSRESYQAVAERYAQARDRLQRFPGVAPECIQALTRKIEHFQQRTRMRDGGVRRLPAILAETWRGNYARYSYGWKSIAQDLFL
jgi:glycosyltransferase involved in cell wall biosynthesis